MKTLLWLDDIRDPKAEKWNNDIAKYIGNPLEMDIVWIKNYNSFITYIKTEGLPDIISFDHDLGDLIPNRFDVLVYTSNEKTGMDCAKWLVNFCMDCKISLPQYYVHSSNPVGADNIRKLLRNFEKQ